MQTPATSRVDRQELPSILATLCSYESWFGPYHPQTLRLMTEAGVACWLHGELEPACALLERAVRDLGRFLGRGHELRLRGLAALRDLFMYQNELGCASAVQREIVECETERLGADHPGVLDARTLLAEIMLKAMDHAAHPEV